MFNFSPRSRDTLTREFWIREEIAHAKNAKELRRAPGAGDFGVNVATFADLA